MCSQSSLRVTSQGWRVGLKISTNLSNHCLQCPHGIFQRGLKCNPIKFNRDLNQLPFFHFSKVKAISIERPLKSFALLPAWGLFGFTARPPMLK